MGEEQTLGKERPLGCQEIEIKREKPARSDKTRTTEAARKADSAITFSMPAGSDLSSDEPSDSSSTAAGDQANGEPR